MALLAMNRRLFMAYLFKEQFEHAWTYTTEQKMRVFLQRWCRLLKWSQLTSRIAFYDLLMRHIGGVVAWARYRLTNTALASSSPPIAAAIADLAACSPTTDVRLSAAQPPATLVRVRLRRRSATTRALGRTASSPAS